MKTDRGSDPARSIADTAFQHALYYLTRGNGKVLAFAVVDSDAETLVPPRGDGEAPARRGLLLYLDDGPSSVRAEVAKRRELLDAYAVGWAGPLDDPDTGERIDALWVEAATRGDRAGYLFVQPYIPSDGIRELLCLGAPFVSRRTRNALRE